MAHRLIQFITSPDLDDTTLKKVVDKAQSDYHATDSWQYTAKDQRTCYGFLIATDISQPLIDLLQPLAAQDTQSRIMIQTVEAVLPNPDAEQNEQDSEYRKQLKERNSSGIGRISREELYNDVCSDAEIHTNFLLMVFFSTIVAAVGLLYNDVAVIVGAMVIAPFLGSNLALSLATVLGDKTLARKAILTGLTGMTITLGMSLLIGLLWPYELDNAELMRRTEVGFSSVFLALSAGAAAVLSLTRGVSSSLVGVMVAAALLPPVATCGLMLGAKQYYHAEGAAVLFAVNIACINIAANIVLLSHGVTPQRWYEKERARRGYLFSFTIWIAILCGLSYLIATRKEYFSDWL